MAADALLAAGEYEHAKAAQKCLTDGQRALQRGDGPSALAQAEQAETLNPGFYQNAVLRARALLTLQRNDEAAKSFAQALREQPAFLKEKQELEGWLKQAQAK